jgi:hypothetical protein
MLIYIIILFLVLITLYFSTKEGLNEVTNNTEVTSKTITDNISLPSNAAVYNTPIQMMDKIKYILDGNKTKEDTENEKLKTQNNVIKEYGDALEGKIKGITGELQILDTITIPRIDDNIDARKRNNEKYNGYIAEANRINKLCNDNGPTNIFIVDQPILTNITNYITMLDTVYEKLKTVNTELMTKYKNYTDQPATNFTKVTANFIRFPDNDTLEPDKYVYVETTTSRPTR